MRKLFNQCLKKPIKVAIILVLLLSSGIILKIKFSSNEQLAVVENNEQNTSSVTVKKGSKVYEVKKVKEIDKEEKGDNSKEKLTTTKLEKNKSIVKIDNSQNQENKSLFDKILNKKETVELDTKDLEAPNNVNEVEVKVLEDNAIIDFKVPEDNGTDYEYVVENDGDVQNVDFHSKSGILGYSYKISNNVNDTADIKPNKLENSSILLQNINWNDDYYLHIRTIDNNMNYSENATIKIDLPSNGVNVEYVEDSTGNLLSTPEKISGMINEDYNASILNKTIADYTFVGTSGEIEGKLKKEAINIKYRYAKNAKLTVKYVDRLTGGELAKSKEILGYEGKEINVSPLDIQGYVPEDGAKTIKMKADEEIVLMYNLAEEEPEEKEQEEANESNEQSNKEKEETNKEDIDEDKKVNVEKEIDKKEQEEVKEKEENNEENNKLIKIKYVDIDTNKILYEEKLTRKGDKSSLKIKLKEIEGYRLVNNIEEPDNNKKSLNSDKELKTKNSTIIDEIIESLGDDEKLEADYNNNNYLTQLEKDSTLAQYEIVMNCDDSDYIIYYKK